MPKKQSKITMTVLEDFLCELVPALKKPGLDAVHNVMEKYNVGYATKITQNRSILDPIISEMLECDEVVGKKKLSNRATNVLALVEEFLDNGADAKELDKYHSNMLGAAFNSLVPQFYRLLLEHGADPNVVDKFGESPLSQIWDTITTNGSPKSTEYVAALEILEILLHNGADPWQELASEDWIHYRLAYLVMNLTSPHCVYIRRRINPILYDLFLKKTNGEGGLLDGLVGNGREVSQATAVSAVYSIRPYVSQGKLDGALDLLRTKFGIDYATTVVDDGQYFLTLLFGELNELQASDNKEQHDRYLEFIARFLDNGIDVNHLDHDGWYPLLTIAAFNREPELCNLLLKYGADPNVSSQGPSPIRAAMLAFEFDKIQKSKLPECVSILLKEKKIDEEEIRKCTQSYGQGGAVRDDSAKQSINRMLRKYGYLPKEEEENKGK